MVSHHPETLATVVEVVDRSSGAGVRVRVELDRHIPMPVCGRAVDAEAAPGPATEPVWRAAWVEEIRAGR